MTTTDTPPSPTQSVAGAGTGASAGGLFQSPPPLPQGVAASAAHNTTILNVGATTTTSPGGTQYPALPAPVKPRVGGVEQVGHGLAASARSRTLPCEWVSKRKRDPDGTVTKCKARLCICGNFEGPDADLGELRRESCIVLWVTRSTMKIVTLSLGSLSLSSGHATCNV